MTGFDVAIQRNSHRSSESQIRTKLNLADIVKFPFSSSKCGYHRFALFLEAYDDKFWILSECLYCLCSFVMKWSWRLKRKSTPIQQVIKEARSVDTGNILSCISNYVTNWTRKVTTQHTLRHFHLRTIHVSLAQLAQFFKARKPNSNMSNFLCHSVNTNISSWTTCTTSPMNQGEHRPRITFFRSL